MAFFSNREKPEIKEEMRMRFCAPSFSFSYGDILDIWSLQDLKKEAGKIRGRIVVLHPGLNTMLSPRHWMKELSAASYLVICGDGGDEHIRRLKKEADRVVYGLVPKGLTGACISPNAEEAEKTVDAIVEETGRDAVTINSTEGELKCSQ